MKAGYIKIFRSIEDWEWFNTPGMLDFWIRILIKAEWKNENESERGCFTTSISELARETNLSEKQVRTFIARLVKTGEIKTESVRSPARSSARMGTTIRTRITICKYDSYQSGTKEVGRKVRQDVGQEEGQAYIYKEEEYNYNTSDTNVSSYSNSIQEEKKKKEEDTDVSSKKEQADFSFVLELWNFSAKRSVPKIRSLSPARKEKVRLRIKEMGGMEKAREILAECFKKIGESDFCNGATGKWVATFDWFFENEKNWLKVLEGNYDNRKEKSQLEIMAENYQKASAYYEQRYRGYGNSPSPYGGQEGGGPYGPDEQ